MLEISHLRSFVAVAEELHFGRAAERLNMTQPPLSRQIQILEHNMKCKLFERSSRSVQLTTAGANFLPEAKRVLRNLEFATSVAQDVAAGRKGIVRCGFTASSVYEFLPRLVAELERQIPGASLRLSEMVSREQAAALRSGDIEIGILRDATELEDFERSLLLSEPMVVALPNEHPLVDQKRLKWLDLHRQRFLGYEPQAAKYFADLIGAKLSAEGVSPTFVQHLSQIHSILSLVRSGTGLAVVPRSAQMISISGVVFREFEDPTSIVCELYSVWRGESLNPLVPLVADIASRCGDHP